MASSYAARRSIITTVAIALVLFLILAGLGAAYWLVTRPVASDDTAGQRDRHFLFSIYGFEGDLLRRPTGVGIDSAGNIMVADTGKRRIVVFKSNGDYLAVYGDPGKGDTQLWQPIDVAAAPDGRTYVVDKGEKKIVIFDAGRRAMKAIKFKDEAPTGVTIANGQLFVTTESGVVIGDLDGQFQTGYIKRGKDPGQFDRPAAVAVGSDGTLYIADSLNYRVQAIGTNGKVKWVYGKPLPAAQAVNYSGKDRKFGLPSSLTLDGNGNVYVVDGLSSEIVVLGPDGQFIEKFGDVGHSDGTFYYPDGIDYAGGRIVVADRFNDRVEVFSAPTSPSLGDNARLNWPWLLLLGLIPLAAWPLMRRGSRYVVAPEFAERLIGDPRGTDVARILRRVAAAKALVAAHDSADLPLTWVARTPKDDRVQEFVARFGLDQSSAAALAVASASRSSVLLAETPELSAAANELGVRTVTFDELADTLGVKLEDADAEGADA